MLVQVDVPTSRLRDVARALKAGFDDLQEMDSGWFFIDFDHPAWGRDPSASIEERIPGNVIVSGDEPADEADALVVAVGYIDPFTGEVHLGNGMVVPADGREEPVRDDDLGDEFEDRRLPAVALFVDGGVRAMIGSLHHTRESRFESASTGTVADSAIAEWLEEIARQGRE